MFMDLRRLRYFVTVAEELHFGRAAKRLHLAQPPLSQQIRLLEADLGIQLFERTTRRVSLTNAGRMLLPDARRLLADADALERVVDDYLTGQAGTLRIGFVDSASYEVMPRFLRSYRQRWPKVSFELRMMSSERQLREIVDGNLDIAISRTPGDEQQIVSTTIVTDPLYLAVDSGHRLADQQSTQLSQLNDETFIGFDRTATSTLHAELRAMLRRHGVLYDPIIEAPEYTTIIGLVAAGEGVALTPASVRTFQPPGLRYLRIRDDEATVTLWMLTRRDEPLTLVTHARDLVAELFNQ